MSDDREPQRSLTATERAAHKLVRKSQPQLTEHEQRDRAVSLAQTLPTLRQPTQALAANTLTMREHIAQLITTLTDIPRTERRRISGYVGQKKRELFAAFTLTYVRSSLTDFRNAVRNAFGRDADGNEHPAVAYLHLNDTDSAAVNDLDRAQVRYQQTALRPIDPDRLIDTAVRLIDSTSVIDVSVGLALLTGRRPYEIFKVGAIEFADDTHVRFIGQAKTQDAPVVVMTIPTLTDAERVVAAWQWLRVNDTPGNRVADEPDAGAVNGRVASRMKARTIENAFVDENGVQLTPKDLRAIYAEIAYAYFGPRTMTKLFFFHRVLGHAETNETSAMSYLRFYIAGRLGDALAQNERAKRDLTIALYAERDAQPTAAARALRDPRITSVESTLDSTSRALIASAVGHPVDPTIAQHAQHVQALKRALSPHQERVLRDLANGISPSLSRDRKTLDVLQNRGVITLTNAEVTQATLTSLGYEVRAELLDQ